MIAALVLAAGQSQRFGYANKLLARSHGIALVAHTLRALRVAPVYPVVVVTGRGHGRVATVARREIGANARLRVVRNRHFRRGMAGSLHAGIAALPRRCDWVLVCLGDMPGLDGGIIRRLLRARRPGLHYVRPVHDCRPGHPVLLSRRLFARIDRGRGCVADSGAQRVLADVPCTRRRLIHANRACVDDIDTPRALRRCTRNASYRPQPQRDQVWAIMPIVENTAAVEIHRLWCRHHAVNHRQAFYPARHSAPPRVTGE